MTETLAPCPQCQEPVHPIPGKGLPAFCPDCRFPLVELAGKYRLAKELSEGGCSKVYLAHHVHLDFDTERVIKVLKSEVFKQKKTMAARFRREVQLTSALSSQNEHIVRIYDDFGEDPKLGYFYVMEYLQGQPLGDAMTHGKPMELPVTFKIFGELCQAIGAAHHAEIIHRDLKPDNIFLVERRADPYFVKVLDFGIAKPLTGETNLKMTQGALGTPVYMSPEQCLNKRVDKQADIYAMGIILYELLTGQNPFGIDVRDPSMSALAVFASHISQPPTPLREWRTDLPDALGEVLLKALMKSPEERFATVEALWTALQQAMQGTMTLPEMFARLPSFTTAPQLPTGVFEDDDIDPLDDGPTAVTPFSSFKPMAPPETPPSDVAASLTSQPAPPMPVPLPATPPLPPSTSVPLPAPLFDIGETQEEPNTRPKPLWLLWMMGGGLVVLALLWAFSGTKRTSQPQPPKRGRLGTLPPIKTARPIPLLPRPRQPHRQPRQQPTPRAPKRPRRIKPAPRTPQRRVRIRRKVLRRRGPCGRSDADMRWVFATLLKPANASPRVTFQKCPTCRTKRRRGGLCLALPKGAFRIQVRVRVNKHLSCRHWITRNKRRLRWSLIPLDNDTMQDEWYACAK